MQSSPGGTLVAALALRLALVVYGVWQDATMLVKYTDIDYVVFTDAARFVSEGESPYRRATYRYTPALAWLLQPNVFLHPACGKLLFVACDVLVGFLILRLTRPSTGDPRGASVTAAQLWLFNPLTMTVTTRGNAESIACALVLVTLYSLKRNERWGVTVAAFVYGVAVHVRIYPVTYALPIYLHLNWRARDERRASKMKSVIEVCSRGGKGCSVGGGGTAEGATGVKMREGMAGEWKGWLRLLVPTQASVTFGVISLITFSALTGAFYSLCGWEFLEQTYLYHITRRDHRHNFSPYFYFLYLTNGQAVGDQMVLSLLAFLPQVALLVCIACVYHRSLEFACLCQTFAFVMFNKVCTSQYFLWYLCLLPLVVAQLHMSGRRAGALFTLWMGGQGLWLAPAYLLEFRALNTFLYIWLAGLIFLLINALVFHQLVTHFVPSTTVPSTIVPSTTVPSTTVPSTTVPSTTVPSTTVPSTTVPSTATQQHAAQIWHDKQQ